MPLVVYHLLRGPQDPVSSPALELPRYHMRKVTMRVHGGYDAASAHSSLRTFEASLCLAERYMTIPAIALKRHAST